MNADLSFINCCDEQRAYIKGHHGEKASIKGVKISRHPFHATARGHCEFCGQEWIAHYSHLTQAVEYQKPRPNSEPDASADEDTAT